MNGMIWNKILHYRLKDKESEYRVIFDSENLPIWFEQVLDIGDLKATKLYKFLIEIGMK